MPLRLVSYVSLLQSWLWLRIAWYVSFLEEPANSIGPFDCLGFKLVQLISISSAKLLRRQIHTLGLRSPKKKPLLLHRLSNQIVPSASTKLIFCMYSFTRISNSIRNQVHVCFNSALRIPRPTICQIIPFIPIQRAWRYMGPLEKHARPLGRAASEARTAR